MADCLGHSCSESRYRAKPGSIKGSVDRTKMKGNCAGITDQNMIDQVTEKLNKALDDMGESEDNCPKKTCICKMPDWPKDWDLVQAGATYTAGYVEVVSGCTAPVTLTYDFEAQERTGKCYKVPPVSPK